MTQYFVSHWRWTWDVFSIILVLPGHSNLEYQHAIYFLKLFERFWEFRDCSSDRFRYTSSKLLSANHRSSVHLIVHKYSGKCLIGWVRWSWGTACLAISSYPWIRKHFIHIQTDRLCDCGGKQHSLWIVELLARCECPELDTSRLLNYLNIEVLRTYHIIWCK